MILNRPVFSPSHAVSKIFWLIGIRFPFIQNGIINIIKLVRNENSYVTINFSVSSCLKNELIALGFAGNDDDPNNRDVLFVINFGH